jgi:epoxyqueuosine reductase QueG
MIGRKRAENTEEDYMDKLKLLDLKKELEHQAREMGARFFGAADLNTAREAIIQQGGDFLGRFARAVSVGIPLHDGIVEQLPRHKERTVAITYDYLYSTVNQSLDRIALGLSLILNDHGFGTFLIPATRWTNEDKVTGLFSHKLAARLAGLGWIGPSCLLITPQAGPRVRWVTILTDALLEPGRPLPDQCGDCMLCVEACPPRAFTGRAFDPSEAREVRFDVQKCIAYRVHLRDKITGVRVCGMCVQVCPFGQNKNKPES